MHKDSLEIFALLLEQYYNNENIFVNQIQADENVIALSNHLFYYIVKDKSTTEQYVKININKIPKYVSYICILTKLKHNIAVLLVSISNFKNISKYPTYEIVLSNLLGKKKNYMYINKAQLTLQSITL